MDRQTGRQTDKRSRLQYPPTPRFWKSIGIINDVVNKTPLVSADVPTGLHVLMVMSPFKTTYCYTKIAIQKFFKILPFMEITIWSKNRFMEWGNCQKSVCLFLLESQSTNGDLQSPCWPHITIMLPYSDLSQKSESVTPASCQVIRFISGTSSSCSFSLEGWCLGEHCSW